MELEDLGPSMRNLLEASERCTELGRGASDGEPACPRCAHSSEAARRRQSLPQRSRKPRRAGTQGITVRWWEAISTRLADAAIPGFTRVAKASRCSKKTDTLARCPDSPTKSCTITY